MYEYPKAVMAVPDTVTVIEVKLRVAKRRRNTIGDLPSDIDVRSFSWLDVKTLLTAAKRMYTIFYSNTVAVFAENCPNMETARFAGCRTISGGVLSRTNERLKNLDISGLKIINRKTMITIAQYNQRLEALNISRCSDLTGRGISLVMRWCVRLRELHMAQCIRVDKNAMKWNGATLSRPVCVVDVAAALGRLMHDEQVLRKKNICVCREYYSRSLIDFFLDVMGHKLRIMDFS
ncbi:hypothetical protein HDV00_010829 [Rhizophlyctis rosea]|nr:hypothetical protein HDV00_010829 [Rhizophlyctis rosea]